MAKNCKTYPTDRSITVAIVPTIFITLALIMFLPSFKYKPALVIVAAIALSVIGYKIGKRMKTTVEICE